MVATEKKKTSLARAVFSGSLGNMLEWFDYGLYGYFAAIISADFFVADDPIVGLLLSFLVFGTGFLVRPIGGILIGAYADKHGRIKALTLTILCMGVCTMLMGCLPTYSQVGILAPILLTVLRLLQGLATGGEFGSSLTFISEYGRRTTGLSSAAGSRSALAAVCFWAPLPVCSSRRSCPKPLCTIGGGAFRSFSAS